MNNLISHVALIITGIPTIFFHNNSDHLKKDGKKSGHNQPILVNLRCIWRDIFRWNPFFWPTLIYDCINHFTVCVTLHAWFKWKINVHFFLLKPFFFFFFFHIKSISICTYLFIYISIFGFYFILKIKMQFIKLISTKKGFKCWFHSNDIFLWCFYLYDSIFTSPFSFFYYPPIK